MYSVLYMFHACACSALPSAKDEFLKVYRATLTWFGFACTVKCRVNTSRRLPVLTQKQGTGICLGQVASTDLCIVACCCCSGVQSPYSC